MSEAFTKDERSLEARRLQVRVSSEACREVNRWSPLCVTGEDGSTKLGFEGDVPALVSGDQAVQARADWRVEA